MRFPRLDTVGRILAKTVKGLLRTDHPILVHLIPMRRCNLSCSYCNEYDDVSKPVPLSEMLRRIDKLADLGTSVITISGGEPLMHPELDAMIAHIRKRGMIVTLITNGYYLSQDRIEALNRAGLDHLEISIDNVEPDDISLKSLRLLEPKLKWLSEHSRFTVTINSVVGSGIKNPADALTIARRAKELGFMGSVGITHDGDGQLKALKATERAVFDRIKALSKRSYARLDFFQRNIAEGKPNEWRCRAGARYVYICEDGLVHYCSQQRGYPGVPLLDYSPEDVQREYATPKACAPYCTVSCVHKVSAFDFFRGPQDQPPPQPLVNVHSGD